MLREGGDVTLIAVRRDGLARAGGGGRGSRRQGVQARVLNMATIAPLDEAAVIAAAVETGRIVTAEEAVASGGLGAAVAEVVVRHRPVPMRILGVPGFAPTGQRRPSCSIYFGLNAEGIAQAARELVG